MITTNGTELYYEREGSGEPLLLVHGLLFSGESWRDQVVALSGEYDCITVDLRGQHRSPAPEDAASYSLWNQAEDIHGLITQLGLAPVHYAGLSMGGMIGMRLALTHPEDLRDLVLVDTSAMGEDPERSELYEALRKVMEEGQTDAVLPALPPVFFADAFITGQPERLEAWLQTLRDGDAMGFVRASRAVDERDDITARLGEIHVPTLVVHGSEDAAIPVENAEALAAGIPGARFQLVDGAGHQSSMDHPDEVTAAIRDFLASVRSAASAEG
ncbi:MAG: 3-oxoadipate enol-lactonase [Chloroflexota bacterium]|jgi:pimeloyl-ACP methyl ester carboxylesterase|nr:3-oxoadipate enol-lactonase [Chloroflexota bacterium]